MTGYTAGNNTKMKIVNATGMLVAEAGFANVSTRAIAERAGENIGSIHYHFGGKDGLFEAVVKEAMADSIEQRVWQPAADLDPADATPEKLSAVLRETVKQQIDMTFRSLKPQWHTLVIYQLLQRNDALTDLFLNDVLEPDNKAMSKLFRLANPDLTDEEVFLHIILLKMPIFSHVNHQAMLLKQLNASKYSDDYLQKMEDLLVRQTQLLLGLPEDCRPVKGKV